MEVFNSSAGEFKLTVHDLVPSDTAQYTCSASSDEDLGTHEMTASITVHCKLQLFSAHIICQSFVITAFCTVELYGQFVLHCVYEEEPTVTEENMFADVKFQINS